jgi:hypothetical protein
MARIIGVYGGLAGLIIIVSLILGQVVTGGEGSMPLLEWLGYLIMLVALSMIFVGIRAYRDRELGGVIRFGTALSLGLGMALLASVIYVAAWEVYLALTDYAFINEYTQSVINDQQAQGVTGKELDAVIAEMEAMKVSYAKPVYRVPMTFLEIFPVGALVSLVSAAFLRRQR